MQLCCDLNYINVSKSTKLYFCFVNFEKAFDRVRREVIRSAMRKLGVEEWIVSAVVFMYSAAKTVVRTVYGNNNCFDVKVGMHQGSALSPFLFVIVMEALSREFRVTLTWELLYADDWCQYKPGHTRHIAIYLWMASSFICIFSLHPMYSVHNRCGLLLQTSICCIACLCICLLITTVSPAKIAEPMLFWRATCMGSSNYVLAGGT